MARTKHVFKTSEIAGLWLAQNLSDARNPQGNFYFHGKTIYSYGGHFPIATIKGDNSQDVILTIRGYSSTTAQHVGWVKGELYDSGKNIILCDNPKDAIWGYHNANVLGFSRDIEAQVEKLVRAQKPELYLGTINDLQERSEKYIQYFKVETTGRIKNFLVKNRTKAQWKEAIKTEQVIEALTR